LFDSIDNCTIFKTFSPTVKIIKLSPLNLVSLFLISQTLGGNNSCSLWPGSSSDLIRLIHISCVLCRVVSCCAVMWLFLCSRVPMPGLFCVISCAVLCAFCCSRVFTEYLPVVLFGETLIVFTKNIVVYNFVHLFRCRTFQYVWIIKPTSYFITSVELRCI
jgi:hypothetical protein